MYLPYISNHYRNTILPKPVHLERTYKYIRLQRFMEHYKSCTNLKFSEKSRYVSFICQTGQDFKLKKKNSSNNTGRKHLFSSETSLYFEDVIWNLKKLTNKRQQYKIPWWSYHKTFVVCYNDGSFFLKPGFQNTLSLLYCIILHAGFKKCKHGNPPLTLQLNYIHKLTIFLESAKIWVRNGYLYYPIYCGYDIQKFR